MKLALLLILSCYFRLFDSYVNVFTNTNLRMPSLLSTFSDPETEQQHESSAIRLSLIKLSVFLPILLARSSPVFSDENKQKSEITPAVDLPKRIFQTKSGLQYYDIEEGIEDSKSPLYGQLVSFHYTIYYRPLGTGKLEKIDSSYLNRGQLPFLHKHGNGRIARGVDEAIHSMKVGGTRRAIIPKSLGYASFGTGPLPSDPFRRRRLGDVLDFVDQGEGELIFDITLLLVKDDENDQGYYDDVPISQNEVRQLVLKSLNANNPDLYNQMMKTTPKELFKK